MRSGISNSLSMKGQPGQKFNFGRMRLVLRLNLKSLNISGVFMETNNCASLHERENNFCNTNLS